MAGASKRHNGSARRSSSETRNPEPGTADVDIVHTGPGTRAGRYLRRFWQPVYRGADLPPGRARPITMLGEQFTLYRGEGGAAHLLAFRCAHRGTQLSTGWVEGDNLRCFYHGWVYDGAGQCVEQPAEPEPFCQRIRIQSYPVHEYLGLIFAYLGEGAPPPPPRLLEFEERDDAVVQAVATPIWPCNYFNRIDQAADHIHTIFAHRESFVEQGGLQGIPVMSAEETEYGVCTRFRHVDGTEGRSHFQMPNINMFEAAPRGPDTGWTTNVHWRVPIDDGHYQTLGLALVPTVGGTGTKGLERWDRPRPLLSTPLPPEEVGELILAGKAHWDDFLDRRDFVPVQDYVILVGQGAIVPRDQEHLGQTDVGTILIRKVWERELRALAEGRPLKQWTRPYLDSRFERFGSEVG